MIDGYVSIERARKDYGVVVVVVEIDRVLDLFELDHDSTATERARIRGERLGWLAADPAAVTERYRRGELDVHDLVRQYGVILDWGTGELLPDTTTEYRAMLKRRSADFWRAAGSESERTPR